MCIHSHSVLIKQKKNILTLILDEMLAPMFLRVIIYKKEKDWKLKKKTFVKAYLILAIVYLFFLNYRKKAQGLFIYFF